MTATHTITSGATLASKYGSFGFAKSRMIPPPSRLFGLVIGRPNAGKTSLFGSNPEAFIINCDLSSTPIHSCDAEPMPAQIWPGINAQGEFINLDGVTFIPSWEHVEAIKEKLIKAAKDNQPRPVTIVLDGVSSAIGMLKDYVMRKLGKASWQEVHGQQAWGMIYDLLVQFGKDLRAAGYGVYFIAHIVDKVLPVGDDRFDVRIDIAMTDKLYQRLYPLFEIVFGIEKRRVAVTKTVSSDVNIGGTIRKVSREVTENEEKRYIVVKQEALDRILKYRINIPSEIEIGETGGWATFTDAYMKAMTPTPKESK